MFCLGRDTVPRNLPGLAMNLRQRVQHQGSLTTPLPGPVRQGSLSNQGGGGSRIRPTRQASQWSQSPHFSMSLAVPGHGAHTPSRRYTLFIIIWYILPDPPLSFPFLFSFLYPVLFFFTSFFHFLLPLSFPSFSFSPSFILSSSSSSILLSFPSFSSSTYFILSSFSSFFILSSSPSIILSSSPSSILSSSSTFILPLSYPSSPLFFPLFLYFFLFSFILFSSSFFILSSSPSFILSSSPSFILSFFPSFNLFFSPPFILSSFPLSFPHLLLLTFPLVLLVFLSSPSFFCSFSFVFPSLLIHLYIYLKHLFSRSTWVRSYENGWAGNSISSLNSR